MNDQNENPNPKRILGKKIKRGLFWLSAITFSLPLAVILISALGPGGAPHEGNFWYTQFQETSWGISLKFFVAAVVNAHLTK